MAGDRDYKYDTPTELAASEPCPTQPLKIAFLPASTTWKCAVAALGACGPVPVGHTPGQDESPPPRLAGEHPLAVEALFGISARFAGNDPDHQTKMKKRFTVGGTIVGLLYGGGIMVVAFIKGPGTPGMFELLVQAAIVGVFVAAGAVAGFFLGCVVSFFVRKK